MPDAAPQSPQQPNPLDYSGTQPKLPRERSIIPVIGSALLYVLLSVWFIYNLFVHRGSGLLFDICVLSFVLPLTSLYLLISLAHLLNTKKVKLRRMERLYNRLHALYSTPPEYVPVDIALLPRLALRHHRAMTADFARHHFSFLADIEDRARAHLFPRTRFCARQLIDPAATTLATFYIACPPLKQRILQRLVRRPALFRSLHLTTYLSDGTYLATTCPNQFETDDDVPPGRILETVPWAAGIQALILRHRARLTEHLAAHPDLRLETIASPDAVIARANSETIAFQTRRRARGILLPSDLPRYLASNRPAYIQDQTRILSQFLATQEGA